MLAALGYRIYDVEFLAVASATCPIALLISITSRRSDLLAVLTTSLALFLFLDLYFMDVVNPVVGAIDFSVIAASCWVLRRRIVAALAAGGLVFTISVILMAQPLDPPAFQERPMTRAQVDRPAIIHLILDEHCGAACLPAAILSDEERELTLHRYAELGFRVWSSVRSTSSATQVSLSDLMNPGRTDAEVTVRQRPPGFEYGIGLNTYFKHAASLGYRIRVLQSSFMDLCPSGETGRLQCRTYPHNSAGILRYVDLTPTERLRLFLGILDWGAQRAYDTLAYRQLLKTDVGRTIEEWRATRSRWRVQPLIAERMLQRVISDIRELGPGDLYVAHLLLPHHPYVFDEACKVSRPEQWIDINVPSPIATDRIRLSRYARYMAQMECTDHLVAGLVKVVDDNPGLRNGTIVIHGDHGSRIGPTTYARLGPDYSRPDHDRDFRAVLFAVRAPGLPPGTTDAAELLPRLFWSTVMPATGVTDERPLFR